MNFDTELNEIISSLTTPRIPEEVTAFSIDLEILENCGFIHSVYGFKTTDPKFRIVEVFRYSKEKSPEIIKETVLKFWKDELALNSESHEWIQNSDSLIFKFVTYSDADKRFVSGLFVFYREG